jgi:rare lipoprotein A
MRGAAIGAAALALAGCTAIAPREPAPGAPQAKPAAPAPERRPGGYYLDDGPGEKPPADLAAIPDAVPRAEPLHRFANRPYQAFGREYVPLASAEGFRQRGLASWYGRRYHGQRTSSGEIYDMYAMTAAHPLLPIPSYVRVTNLANGRSVVVRINDRGPFHGERIVDLSYTAAWKLGFVEQGTAWVEVEAVQPLGPVLAGAAPGAAAAVAMPGHAPEAADSAPQTSGVFVQLGAFSAPEAAESFRARLALELASLAAEVRIHTAGGLHRLKLGPYRTREAAREIADRIEAALKLRPLVVPR